MIDMKIKYEAGFFLDAEGIKPTPNIIKDLIDIFEDYKLIPNTYRELKANTTNTRILLTTLDNEWKILIGTDRIYIQKLPTDLKGDNLGEIEEFTKEVINIHKLFSTKFIKKAKRLALMTNYILREMDEKIVNTIYQKLFKYPILNANNIPYEWHWKTASKLKKSISKKEEDINFVTTIERVSGRLTLKNEVKDFDRIQIELDINTDQNNKDYRFDIPELSDFYSNVGFWQKELLDNILNLIR